MRLTGLLAFGLAISAARLCAEGQKVPCPEVRRMQLAKEYLIILDVRPPADYATSHIQGALNIPGGEIGSGGLPKDKKIVVYCPQASCLAAENAAEKLKGLGYANTAILEGGLAGWVSNGYPVAGANSPVHAKPKIGRMALQDVKARIAEGKIVVLDVRPEAEFAAGHLPGARNLPLESLGTELARIAKDEDLLVYDRQAGRTRKAAESLLEAGYRVFELPGGLAGWVKKGYELEVK